MSDQTRARRARLPGSVSLAALVLAALTLFSLLAVRPVRAAEWMEPYLEIVQEWGVMRGDSQGNLHEDRNITRAEFVTLVNRAFGYTDVGPHTFADVNPNDWFAEDISIAHQAGYFNGSSPTTAAPYALVTREQAAVFLGRCLRFQGVTGAANSTFTDMYEIGGWSRGLVQEAAELGIIQGYSDGSFRPKEPITRGQMACFLVRALGTLIQEPGEQTSGGVYGNLTITTPGVKLKDTIVTGNLYLTGGVGLGNVELENVEVLGKIVICGGGEAEGGKHSVVLRNVTAGGLELDSISGQFLSLEAEGLTNIDEVTIRSSAYIEDRTEDGLGLQTIRLDGTDGSQFQLAGNLKRVINFTPNSKLQIAQGVADVVTVDEKAEGSTVTIDNLASIRELNLDRATQVTGEGSISHLNVNAPGSTVSMLPDTIYIRPGITANVHGQNMDNKTANEASEDPRILAGYPKARNIAPTSANAVFRTNKAGTIRWALTALMDGSVGEEELLDPSSYPKIIRSGSINATAANTDFTARLTGLTREGSYYLSAMLEDARGRRSPVKVLAFTTPDDSAPNFAAGYPQTPILTLDADNEQVAQVMVMATKNCQMYYALFPRGSTAPTAADFRTGALPGNLGHGVVDLRKNTPFLVSRINTSHLQEQTQYDLYLWLNDADNGKSSTVRKLTFTTKDLTPPTIQDLHMVSNAARSVTMSFTLDEPGTLNWVVVKQGDNFGINKENPTKLDQIRIEGVLVGGRVIRKGGPVRAARGGTAYSFTVTGLEPQTSYDLFYTAKDTAGNYCVYNKTIDFPYPIKTLDNENPTATLDFSDKTTDANNVDRPWAESDVYIEFSEVVQGIGDRNLAQPDDLYALYQRVENSSGSDKDAAKRDLATVLQKYISFYTGNPPANANGRPRPESKVTVKDGSQSTEQLEAAAAWIDYREAKVSREDGKTVITFPGDGVGLKLQSGASYYFMLQNIEDTSSNPMVSPTYLRFTTAFATINIFDNTSEESVTYNGETRPAEIFYMVPEGTEAVSRDTRWDMIIWTNASMKYDLFVRPHVPGSSWTLLGTVRPNLSGSGGNEVYNSLNGNFNSSGSTTLISSGLFGSITADKGRPYLNEFVDELEFAVVPTESTVTQRVNMYVQVFAGTNTELASIARTQGTAANLTDRNITAIGDPDRFPITIDPPDKAPVVSVQGEGIILGSERVQVHVNVNNFGTVYWMAIPLENVQTDSDDKPIGNTYTMREEYPGVDAAGTKPRLEIIPTSYDANPPLWLHQDHPMPEYVVNAEEYVQNALTTKFGDTGDTLKRVRGTQLDIQGLIPNRTYLLYLATTNTAGTMCDQVLCYKFTTTPPDPPVITIDPSGTTGATFTVTPSSTLSFVLVRNTYFNPGSSNVFNRAFSGSMLDTTNPLPSGWSGTVLDAMLQSYPGSDNSIFDKCASTNTKRTYANYISVNPNEIFLEFGYWGRNNLPARNSTGLIGFSEHMSGTNYYTVIAVATADNSTITGFRASQSYYNTHSRVLKVQSCLLNPVNTSSNPAQMYTGTLELTFSDDLHYRVRVGSQETGKPVDTCQDAHGMHVSTNHLGNNDHVNIGYVMHPSMGIELTNPAINTNNSRHGTTVGPKLTFRLVNAGAGSNISFRADICGPNGVVRENTPDLQVILKAPDATHQTWWVDWDRAWNVDE